MGDGDHRHERPDDRPGDGDAVWRADDERVVADLTQPSGDAPYGPEADTSRPAEDRPPHVERGEPARDVSGMSTAGGDAATGRRSEGREPGHGSPARRER